MWIGVGTAHPHLFQIHERVQERRSMRPRAGVGHFIPTSQLLAAGMSCPISPQVFQVQCEVRSGNVHVEDFHLYSSKLTPAGPIHTRELTVSCSRGR